MAEPDRIDNLEFEITDEETPETPEFCLEEQDDVAGTEFSLDEAENVQAESDSTEEVSSSEISTAYSDDILSPPVNSTSVDADEDNPEEPEAISIELDSEPSVEHSTATLHIQQAQQLEMSLLERIDDLIQVLEKRGRAGSSPEQLPHKQFATGLHYIKHENNHYLGAKWMRKAAMQGHAKAQLYLGMLFLQGNGVPKSLFHAYAWFSLAVCQNIPEAVDARKKLEKHLTAKEINASLKYAADLLDKIHLP